MAQKIETALLNWREDEYLNPFEFLAHGNEEKELDKEGDLEDTENGSKGIQKMKDDDHVIDININLF